MTTLFLSKHIYLAQTAEYLVALDLKRNKYLGISHAQERALSEVVSGLPIRELSDCSNDQRDRDDCGSLIAGMIRDGMLTDDPNAGKQARLLSLPQPATALIEGYSEVPAQVRLRDVKNFCLSCLIKVSAPTSSLQRVVSRVAKRRATVPHSGTSTDLERARELVSIFCDCRPFLFTARGSCLFDSLALLDFLSRYSTFPQLVIGVQVRPFTAHAWLQSDTVTLNDTPEFVRGYTPIFAF
jgi:hypothetical protein